MSTFLKRAVGGMVLAVAMVGSAQAVPLSTLLGGGSITAGDKLFDNWTLINYTSTDAARSLNAGNIDVTALNDGGLDPGPGLRFSISGGELTVTGDDIFAFVDLMLGFRAAVLTPGFLIKDNSLEYAPAGAFHSVALDDDWDAGSFIRETVGSDAGLEDLGVKNVEFSTLAVPGTPPTATTRLSDRADFAPHGEVWITKNLYVWARDATDSAGILGFEQRFSQTTVPEPSSCVLVVLALAGALAPGALRRRREKLAA